jgi:hypothetical protein
MFFSSSWLKQHLPFSAKAFGHPFPFSTLQNVNLSTSISIALLDMPNFFAHSAEYWEAFFELSLEKRNRKKKKRRKKKTTTFPVLFPDAVYAPIRVLLALECGFNAVHQSVPLTALLCRTSFVALG